MSHLVELLAAAASAVTGAARRCLEAALFQSGAIDVYFDGVDEVCPSFKDKMLRILQLLQQTRSNVVWVSSRPEVSEPLSRTLRCTPASLRALTRPEQEQYLREHWASAQGGASWQFATLAAETVSALARASAGLLDVPLHVHMAAEAFAVRAGDAARCGRGLFHGGALSLLDLYRFFVERRRVIFNERHGLHCANFENLPHTDEFYERHLMFAMMLLLSDGSYNNVDIRPFEEYVKAKLEVVKKEKTGILWADENGFACFVHFSFVEYFASQWLLANAVSNDSARSVIHNLYTGRRTPLLRDFLERMLVYEEGASKETKETKNKHANKGEVCGTACVKKWLPLHEVLLTSPGSADAGQSTKCGCSAGQPDVSERIHAEGTSKETNETKNEGEKYVADRVRRLPLLEAVLANPRGAGAGQPTKCECGVEQHTRCCRGAEQSDVLKRVHAEGTPKETNDESQTYADGVGKVLPLHEAVLVNSRGAGAGQITKCGCSSGQPTGCFFGADQHDVSKPIRVEETSKDTHVKSRAHADDIGNGLPLHEAMLVNPRGAGAGQFTKCGCISGPPTRCCFSADQPDISERIHVEGTSKETNEETCGADDIRKGLPLHEAVLANHEGLLEAALAAGAQADATDAGGRSALHMAASRRFTYAIQRLLDVGCDPSRRDALLGWTPLRYLDSGAPSDELEWTDLKAVEALLQAGADPQDLVHLAEIDRETQQKLFDSSPMQKPVDCPKLTLWWLRQCGGVCIYGRMLRQAVTHNLLRTVRALLEGGAAACEFRGSHRRRQGARALLRRAAVVCRRFLGGVLHKCSRGGDHRGAEEEAFTHALEFGYVQVAQCFTERYWALSNVVRKDVKRRYSNGKTLLHLAIEAGKLRTAEAILKKGADVAVRTDNGSEPLHYAVRNSSCMDNDSRLAAVRLLLRYEADPNVEDNEGNLILINAALIHEVEVLKTLLDNGGNIHCCDKNGRGLLHYAANASIVNLLLERGIDVNEKDSLQRVALHSAAALGHVSSVEALLRYNEPDIGDVNGTTPLHLAAVQGHIPVVNVLVNRLSCKKIHVDIADCKGYTPFYYAAALPQFMRTILDIPGSPRVRENIPVIRNYSSSNTREKEYETDHTVVVTLLLEKGADLNKNDSRRRAPIHWAAEQGDFQMVKLLINHKARVDQCDSDGLTALHLAAANRHCVVAEVLLVHGANPLVADSKQLQPLNHVFKRKLQWKDSRRMVELLLNAGAEPNWTDEDGSSPLHYAAYCGHFELVDLLLKHKATVDKRNSKGNTPLHLATLFIYKDEAHKVYHYAPSSVIRYPFPSRTATALLSAGAEVDCLDAEGCSALHHAAHVGLFDVAKILLKYKARLDCQDRQGRTALDIAKLSLAKHEGIPRIKEILEKTVDLLKVTSQDSFQQNNDTSYP